MADRTFADVQHRFEYWAEREELEDLMAARICNLCGREDCARLRRGACDACYMRHYHDGTLDALPAPHYGQTRGHLYAVDSAEYQRLLRADAAGRWQDFVVLDWAGAEAIYPGKNQRGEARA